MLPAAGYFQGDRGPWSKKWDAGHVLPGKVCPVVHGMGRGARQARIFPRGTESTKKYNKIYEKVS